MAWPVYSTRFIRSTLTGVWEYVTIPWGSRGVIKCMIAVNVGGSSALVRVNAGGAAIWVVLVPGPSSTRIDNLMAVVYEGETIGINSASADVAVSIHGHLLGDPAGGRAAGAAGAELEVLAAEELPARIERADT